MSFFVRKLRWLRIRMRTRRFQTAASITVLLFFSQLIAYSANLGLPPLFPVITPIQRTFVGLSTTFAFSLTSFILIGLAVLAALDVIRTRIPRLDNEEDDEFRHSYRELRFAFRSGAYYTISAAVIGIVFQSIAPETLAEGVFGLVQLLVVYFGIFYLFVFIFAGMVLTAVDIVELILELDRI